MNILKRSTTIISLTLLLLFSSYCGTQYIAMLRSSHANTKIGVVDMQKVLAIPALKKINEDLFEPLNLEHQQLLKLQEDYLKAKSDFNNNKLSLSEMARTKQASELNQLEKQFKEKAEVFNQKFSNAQATFQKALEEMLEKAALKNRLDVIFVKGNNLVYCKDRVEVTQQVIDSV